METNYQLPIFNSFSPPPLPNIHLYPQLVQDPLHHKIHQLADLGRPVIEAGCRGNYDGAGFRDRDEIAEMNQGEGSLPRDQDQLAPFLEHHVRGALDQ